MTSFGIAVALCMAAISLLHLMWAFGIWWPIRDEVALARAIAGFRGIDAMPPRAAGLFVALATGATALLCLVLAGNVVLPLPRLVMLVAGLGAAGVLFGRGVLGFARYWERKTPEQPFRRLDRKYYSPACLVLGISIAVLSWSYFQ
jgi:hypothetical protein